MIFWMLVIVAGFYWKLHDLSVWKLSPVLIPGSPNTNSHNFKTLGIRSEEFLLLKYHFFSPLIFLHIYFNFSFI